MASEAWHVRRLSFGSNAVSLQLLLSNQVTKENCNAWADELLKNPTVTDVISPLMEKWLKDSVTGGILAFTNFRLQVIASVLISFTATVEHFLKDCMIEYMRRNKGLREQSFRIKDGSFDASNFFSPEHLEKFDHIERAKKFVMHKLASHFTKGGLFSSKFKRVARFLNLDPHSRQDLLKSSMDSIWTLRNTVAHTDMDKIEIWEIIDLTGNTIAFEKFNFGSFLPFAIVIIKTIDAALGFLKDFNDDAEAKWPVNEEISNVFF